MRKLTFIIGLIAFIYACNNKIDSTSKNTKTAKTYNIETTTYWDIPNTIKDTIPFIELKVDTLNHIGSNIRYNESGKIFERIVILDKTKALKLDYNGDTIALITPCKYFLRKDHPSKEIYSIVVYN